MTQLARAARAPGSRALARSPGGNHGTTAARLSKLAESRSTGSLPFSGLSEGAIYFRGGLVTGAHSSRTPQPANAAGHGLLGAAGQVEQAIDAVLDLVASEAAYSRFRASKGAPVRSELSVPVSTLLVEVARRQHVAGQMAGTVTADTPVLRRLRLPVPRIQVSAAQWALLRRAGTSTTPRELAWAVGNSVFGTTVEVFRLLGQGLMSLPEAAVPSANSAVEAGSTPAGPVSISFIRAVRGER